LIEPQELIPFLSHFWTTPPEVVKFSESTQLFALKIFEAILRSDQKRRPIFSDFSLVLVLLGSKKLALREAALSCLKLYQRPNAQKGGIVTSLNSFLETLEISAELILAEGSNLPSLFSTIFSRLSSSDSLSLQQLFVTHVLNFTHPYPRYTLLKALEAIEQKNLVSWYLPFLKEKLGDKLPPSSAPLASALSLPVMDYYEALTIDLILRDYQSSLSVLEKEEASFAFFLSLFTTFRVFRVHDPATKKTLLYSSLFSLLSSFSVSFFTSLSVPRRQALFIALSDLLLPSSAREGWREYISTEAARVETTVPCLSSSFNASEMKEKVRELIKELPVSPSFVEAQLKEISDDFKQRKARLDNSEDRSSILPGDKVIPPKLVVLLEMFQYKPALLSPSHLPHLFSILSFLADSSFSEANPSSEYTEQLVLTSLVAVTQLLGKVQKRRNSKSEEDEMEEEDEISSEFSSVSIETLTPFYDISLIIDCIRVSENPSIHNNCLLLLSSVAILYPRKVLSHVVSIFTFMGLSTKRLDDNYSFLVLQRTIESVVPSLLSLHSSPVERSVAIQSVVEEMAVMVDTFHPLQLTRASQLVDDPQYPYSWL